MDTNYSAGTTLATADISEDIVALLENPSGLILQGGKYGVKGVAKFFLIVILFAIVNFIILVYAFFRGVSSTMDSANLVYVGLILGVGVIATVFAGFKAYNYVRTDALRVVYEKLRPYFPGLCRTMVDRVMQQKIDLNNPNVKKTLDFYSLFNQYFQKVPSMIRKWLFRKLDKIPFMTFLREMQSDLVHGNREVVAMRIYEKSDALISEGFEGNNNRWILWLLPLNLAVQIFIITRIY